MNKPTFTPEGALALAQQYDLLLHETISLPWASEMATHVHTERIRRLYEWAQTEGVPAPQPCCPFVCENCDEAHTCFDDSPCIGPCPEGIEWLDDEGVLAQIPFDVLWSNDPDKTESLIAHQVEKSKDFMRQRAEESEMAERALMAQLQHKYEGAS